MKNIDVGQLTGICANLGVLAGIVFLGMEVQQNNELLDSQARQNIANGLRELNAVVYDQETGLSAVITKAKSGAELTEDEAFRVDRYLTTVIISWEYWYRDYADGIINEEELRYSGWGNFFYDVLPERMAATWESTRTNSSLDFVEFMEENVVTYKSINDISTMGPRTIGTP